MITFELRGKRRFDGKILVREWFSFEAPSSSIGGKPVRIGGWVDEDIIKENRKEYLAFRAKVEADEEAAYAAARRIVEGE